MLLDSCLNLGSILIKPDRVKPRVSELIMIKSCEDKILLKSQLIPLKLYSSWLNRGLPFCEGRLYAALLQNQIKFSSKEVYQTFTT